MNRKRIAAATLVLVTGVAVVVLASTRKRAHAPLPATADSNSHGAGIDHAMGAVVALYHGPDGGTPCETAYNAFKHSLDVSTEKNLTPVVLKLAPRDQFLATCGSLPPGTQQCMVPLYLADHRPECAKLKPPQSVLDSLIEMKQAAEPGSPGVDEEHPEQP